MASQHLSRDEDADLVLSGSLPQPEQQCAHYISAHAM